MLNLKDNNSLVKKIVFLFILAILLQIPMFFINGIIDERDYSYRNMTKEIGKEWGEKQTISGAFLTGIYAVLYSILKIEQYALMTGTFLLMAVLYVMMYITRNIETFKED